MWNDCKYRMKKKTGEGFACFRGTKGLLLYLKIQEQLKRYRAKSTPIRTQHGN